MAGRNRKNSAEYFSHDVDASNDEKIIYLESLFGHTGYAVYFKFLERMARSDNFEIDWNNIKKAIYAAEFHISVTEIEQIITECCRQEIKAFEIEDGKLFSIGLKKRMQPLIDKREYNRKKYEEKKQQENNELDISVTEKHISADEMTQSKGKERKVYNKKNLQKILLEKITIKKLDDHSDIILEFFNYRFEIKKPYKSDRGLDGLLKDICACSERGMDINSCLVTAMENGWLKPSPDYFKNNQKPGELTMMQKAF